MVYVFVGNPHKQNHAREETWPPGDNGEYLREWQIHVNPGESGPEIYDVYLQGSPLRELLPGRDSGPVIARVFEWFERRVA